MTRHCSSSSLPVSVGSWIAGKGTQTPGTALTDGNDDDVSTHEISKWRPLVLHVPEGECPRLDLDPREAAATPLLPFPATHPHPIQPHSSLAQLGCAGICGYPHLEAASRAFLVFFKNSSP